MIPTRRRFLIGAASLLAAPAIVRVASIMPVSVPKPEWTDYLSRRWILDDPQGKIGRLYRIENFGPGPVRIGEIDLAVGESVSLQAPHPNLIETLVPKTYGLA